MEEDLKIEFIEAEDGEQTIVQVAVVIGEFRHEAPEVAWEAARAMAKAYEQSRGMRRI